MIEVDRLTKTFGTHVALSEVTFCVPRGSVVGLLGRNGAGKTTTLRVLAGVVRPTQGRVRLDGLDSAEHARQVRGKVGYLAESAALYPELRVEEHLLFRAAQKGLPRARRLARVEQTLSTVNAKQWRDVLCAQLSRGMRQRVGLADALLTEPSILLLDEPTAGLDPTQTRETRELLHALGASCTVVVSTHILAEVDAMCDSAIIIDAGRVLAQGSLSELYALGQSTSLVMTLRADAHVLEPILRSLEDVKFELEPIESDLVRVVLNCADGISVDETAERAIALVTSHGIGVREVTRRRASLEQVFSALTLHEERV